MHDLRSGRVLCEREHYGSCGIGTEKRDAFGETITVDIGLGGDKRSSIGIYQSYQQEEDQKGCDQPVATNGQLRKGR